MNSPPYPGPADGYFYRDHRDHPSATATPSPRAAHSSFYETVRPPPRPATRAAHGHTRHSSSSAFESTSKPWSPRYHSNGSYGTYATANVSDAHAHYREESFSTPTHSPPHHHTTIPRSSSTRDARRRSVFQTRPPRYGVSDDEFLEPAGRSYASPDPHFRSASAMNMRQSRHAAPADYSYSFADALGQGTDYFDYKQGAHMWDETLDPISAFQSSAPRAREAATARSVPPRRPSTSMHTRPQTVRPSSSHGRQSAPRPGPPAPAATAADILRHEIPEGYSTKNWDPSQKPIYLLGSVFDANSLGKWIYDWAAFTMGTESPIANMAGELWLALILLSGNIRCADKVYSDVRSKENRETLSEFIEGGERLLKKLHSLLAKCERPMLKAIKKSSNGTQLDSSAGKIFVRSLFGADQFYGKTERFMKSMSLFNLRFSANCEDIVNNPTA